MENPSKMDDLGIPLFLETSTSLSSAFQIQPRIRPRASGHSQRISKPSLAKQKTCAGVGCENPKEQWPKIIQEPESPIEKCETQNIKKKKQPESFSNSKNTHFKTAIHSVIHFLTSKSLGAAEVFGTCAVKVDLDVPHDAMRKPCPTYGVQVWSPKTF